jgi:neutral ceramidase
MQNFKKYSFSGFKRNTIFKSLLVCNLVLFLTHVVYSQQIDSNNKTGYKKFRASVVKSDITPENSQYLLGYNERKSTGVDNRIYHRIVALDDGETQFFLVSTEVCLFSPVEYDRIAEKIKDQLGIDPLHLWWTVTHTHSAPEFGPSGLDKSFLEERFQHEVDADYSDFVEKKLSDGIKKAREKLSPAKLGVGWGYSQANINRRAKDIDGEAFLGFEPDGPVDRRIGLLRIDKEDGSPLVCIANYPIHGTVLGNQNLKINGDVPGIVSAYFEQEMGIPLLFINGAAGNLAPIYSGHSNPQAGHLSQFQVLLGDKILEAYRKILFTTNLVKISAGSLVVETPKKYGMKWPENFDNYIRTTEAGVELIKLPVRFLKLNEDIAVWSSPVELFCEISNEIRECSPYPYTFYFGYTNGWFGYLLTSDEYSFKGYEPEVSPFTPEAENDLKKAVKAYLQGEMKTLHSYYR